MAPNLLTLLVHLEYCFIRPYPLRHFFDFDVVIALIFLLAGNILYVTLYFYDSFRRSKAEKNVPAQALQAVAAPRKNTEQKAPQVREWLKGFG